MLKWVIELSEYGIKYQPRLLLKRQVMADFIVELPQKSSHLDKSPGKGWWTLHVDRTSKSFNFKVGIILQASTRELLEQAIRLNFSTSKNEVEYEAILVGLDLALTMTMTKLEICNDSQLIIEQI